MDNTDSVYPDAPVGTNSDNQRFAEAVRLSYARAKTFRSEEIDQKWNYHFSLLNSVDNSPQVGNVWRTNRRVNMIKVASTIFVSMFYQGLPIGAAEGRNLAAQVNEDAINQKLQFEQEQGRLEQALGNTIDDGVNYACGLLYIGWRTETVENVPRTKGFWKTMIANIRKISTGFKEKELLYDGMEYRWVDPFTFYWDPNGIDIDDCAYCMEVTDETIYQLRKDPSIDQDILDDVMMFSAMARAMKTADEGVNRFVQLGMSHKDARRVYGKVKDGLHEVARYWGSFDIENTGREVEVKGIVIDGYFVGNLEENPFNHGKKPYAKWDFNKRPGTFIGYSLIDQAAESQEETNDLTNQASDVRKMVAKPMVKMRMGADVVPEDISFAPGAINPVEQMDDLEYYQPDTSALDALLAMKKDERENFQLLTGMNDVILGQKDVGIGDNTATGAAIAQEQTQLRYKAAAVGLDLFMERIGELTLWNIQQFTTSKQVVPVRDEIGKVTYQQIRPKDISGLFSYRITSSSLSASGPTQRINNLLKAMQILNGNPNYTTGPVIDQIITELGLDPGALKQANPQQGAGAGQLDQVQKFAQLPQQQQQALLAKMNPQQQQLMMRALQALNPQGNANPQAPAPQPTQATIVQSQPVPAGAGALPAPAQSAGMGTPGR